MNRYDSYQYQLKAADIMVGGVAHIGMAYL
jgi:hypothetical protein